MCIVRYANSEDFNEIVEIANTNGVTWATEEIRQTLNEVWNICIVAIDKQDKILGFCIYSLMDKEVLMILHLAVKPEQYKKGIATKLIQKIKYKLDQNEDRKAIIYAIPETNLSGQLFLKKMGFKATLVKSQPEDITEFVFTK